MRSTASYLSLALLMAFGCRSQPVVDVEAERNALMEADRAWSEAYAASDNPADVFVAQMTGDAKLLPPDAPISEGKDAIRDVVNMLEALPGFSVTWGPVAAEVGSGGDLGYTRGTYVITMDGPDGPITINGKYITVWKKQADGTWLVTADMFNQDAPTPPM
jgi:ketosteroid isomerase-like protein